MNNDGSMFGGLFSLVVFVAFYVYFAVAIQTMAKKTNTPNNWMAWIPLLNVYLLLKIGGKPGWWLLLFLIPFVNFIMMIVMWMGVAERLNKPNWYGILMIVPLVNIIIPGVLAFSDSPVVVSPKK